ncbi:heavy metal translocating P-type ATPase [Mycolicibacterium sp. CBM1]
MDSATPREADALGRFTRWALLAVTFTALLAGGVAWLMGAATVADACWIAGTVAAVVPALWWVVAAVRGGRVGVDVLAVLSLCGALAVREYLAGALIGVMLATGQALDAAAERRATKDLRALLDRVPRTARRRRGDGVEVVGVDDIVVDDVVLVGPGEVLPVDGVVLSESAVLDDSALTGESVPVRCTRGDQLRSGSVNAGGGLELRASASAADSTYAGIVRLARQAAAESAPVVRLADRVAAWFLPVALVVAGLAWIFSGTAERAVAVLVVATPCPLLLAAPVAIVSGLSRTSRIGVLVRGGGALETLGRATTLVLDKTGTLTSGRPRGTDIVVAPGRTVDEILALAASAEQLSPHVLAAAIVREARARGLPLTVPTSTTEEAGTGVSAVVDGKRVSVGNLTLGGELPHWAAAVVSSASLDGAMIAWVRIDDDLAGAILLTDPPRPDAPRTLRRLREAGMTRLVMLTGDQPAPAQQIGIVLGLDEVAAQQTPADKVARVRAESERAVTAMVGDGVNDAPALAAADVGIAMGARGATASSEAADIVLTADRLDRIADAKLIARRSRRIAVQSAVVGMSLSLVAMGFAAFGWLPPAAGALLQEGIDLAVILNALRALGGDRGGPPPLSRDGEALVARFSAEHDQMRDDLAVLRDAAHQIASGSLDGALLSLRAADAFLQDTLLPHEEAEDSALYPALARPLGSGEATATMSRMHAEIHRLAQRLHTHRELADAAGAVRPEQSDDLLACLYGLYALLRLHFVQEEENFFVLAPAFLDGTDQT